MLEIDMPKAQKEQKKSIYYSSETSDTPPIMQSQKMTQQRPNWFALVLLYQAKELILIVCWDALLLSEAKK